MFRRRRIPGGRTAALGGGPSVGWRGGVRGTGAQTLANQGKLVLISYANPDPDCPGHIVIVQPSTKSAELLVAEGPDIVQAGMTNHNLWSASSGFHGHRGAWPDGVDYFADDLD